MSGHFATLLRQTVRTMLPDHDLYITDWKNARDIPPEAGIFGFDAYVEHLIRFIVLLGPGRTCRGVPAHGGGAGRDGGHGRGRAIRRNRAA